MWITLIKSIFFYENQSNHLYLYKKIIYFYLFILSISLFIDTSSKDLELWQPISFFILIPPTFLSSLLPYLNISLIVASLLAVTGYYIRFASLACFILFLLTVGYYMNFGKVFHGHHLLAMTLGILFFAPITPNEKKQGHVKNSMARTLSWKYHWPIQLIKIYSVSIYFSNGWKKIIYNEEGWWDGTILYSIILSIPGKSDLVNYMLDLPLIFFQFGSLFVLIIVQLLAPISLINQKLSVLYFFIFTSFHVSVISIFGGHLEFLSFVVCNTVFLPLGSWYPKVVPIWICSNTNTSSN
jgi:hypothetical protein